MPPDIANARGIEARFVKDQDEKHNQVLAHLHEATARKQTEPNFDGTRGFVFFVQNLRRVGARLMNSRNGAILGGFGLPSALALEPLGPDKEFKVLPTSVFYHIVPLSLRL